MSEQDSDGRLSPEQVEALVRAEIPGLKINQGKIKLREWDDLEDVADRPVSPWVGANFPPVWFIQGVLWLWLRRKHPQLTYQDMGELDMELLQDAQVVPAEEPADGVDPTSGNTEPSSNGQRTASPASATSGG